MTTVSRRFPHARIIAVEMLRGPDHIAMRTGVCEVCIRDQLSQHIGAHPQGNQMNTPSRFVNEETSSGNPVPRGETLENEIVDPRFCDCVVFGAWRHCRRGIDAGARDLLLAERKVGTTRRVEWSPPPHRRLCCRSEKNYLRQHDYFSRHCRRGCRYRTVSGEPQASPLSWPVRRGKKRTRN